MVSSLPRATLGVLCIVALIASTVWILRPFLGATIWAATIVIATWPVMRRLQAWLWGRRSLAVAAMLATWVLILLVPLSLATGTVAQMPGYRRVGRSGAVVRRADAARVGGRPALVGKPAMEAWQKIAASPIGDLASTAAPYAVTGVAWIAGTLRSLGWLLMQFLLTLIIATVMYAKGEGAADGCLRFGRKLAGEQGDRVVRLAAQAIRGVALGIVVTALVQTALTGVALAIAGVPFAALLSVVAFVSCIAQLGPALVLMPSVAWLYWQGATGTATALLLWSVVVVTLDNIPRPCLVTGRRPAMLVMFTGVIGGLLAFGLIGLLSARVLAGLRCRGLAG